MSKLIENPATSTDEALRADASVRFALPWQVIVWDDPVNLMSYVSYVFRSYFGFSRERAEHLMLLVHNEGKAAVASGNREQMEMHVEALHGFGLQATLERAEA